MTDAINILRYVN